MIINSDRLEALRCVRLTEALNYINCYWKWSSIGDDRYLHINFNNKDYDFSVIEKFENGKLIGTLWNDRNRAKQPNEPPREGVINFIQYLTGKDFYHTVRFLEGAING